MCSIHHHPADGLSHTRIRTRMAPTGSRRSRERGRAHAQVSTPFRNPQCTPLPSPLQAPLPTCAQVESAVTGVRAHKYDGVLPALRAIYREEGVAGWYQGLTPTICSVAIFWYG